jgi:hypothetical protein
LGTNLRLAVAQLHRAAELDLDTLGGAHHLPRVRVAQPVVRPLLLPAAAESLVEDAMLVAQAIAYRWQRHGRHRVEKAGREAPQAAVAQARVRLLIEKLHPELAVFAEARADDGIEHHVHYVVGERPADEELDRDIVDALGVLALVGLVGLEPAVRQNVAHRPGGRLVALPRVR